MNAVTKLILSTVMKTLLVVYVFVWLFLLAFTRNMYKYESMRGVPDPMPVTLQLQAQRSLPYVSAGLVLLLGVNLFLHFKRKRLQRLP